MEHFFNKNKEGLGQKGVFSNTLNLVHTWDEHRKNGTSVGEIPIAHFIPFNFFVDFLKEALTGLSILKRFSPQKYLKENIKREEFKILGENQQNAILELSILSGEESEKIDYYEEKIVSFLVIGQIIRTQLKQKETVPDLPSLVNGQWINFSADGSIEYLSGTQVLENNIERLKCFLSKRGF